MAAKYIPTFIFLGCIILFMVGLSSSTAPVYGLKALSTSNNTEPEEFLIMLKRKGSLQQKDRWENVKQFCEALEERPVVSDVLIFHEVIVLVLVGNRRVIERIQEHDEVEIIQGSLPIKINQEDNPQVSCLHQNTGEELWGLSRIGHRQLESYAGEQYTYAEMDGKDVQVYVVDSGVFIDHEDFEGRASHGYTAKMMRSEGDSDLNGHGTHVAGTVAGRIYGVAKQAEIIAVKVLNGEGGGTSKTLLEGLQWVLDDFINRKQEGKAKGVVNLSLGVAEGQVDRLLEEVVHELIEEGLTVVVAAGNNGGDTCQESPARMSTVISVAATTESDTIAAFSNHGSCVDILAPGTSILSASIESTTASTQLQGTSMAAPHVAGVVARLMSQLNISLTHSQSKSWLLDSATIGVINVRNKIDTPNKFLYMPCVGAHGMCLVVREDSHANVRSHSAPASKSEGPPLLILTLAAVSALLGILLVVAVVMLFRNKKQYEQKIASYPTYRGRSSNYDAVRTTNSQQPSSSAQQPVLT